MDTYQGKIGTVSPAVGNYDITTYINIDKEPTGENGVTGIGPTGLQGSGTLISTKWDQGVTGIQGSYFTNAKRGL